MATPSHKAFELVVMRRACALLGLFALFLQGSSGGHMLLVEHAHCAEHGELVHGELAHRHIAAGEHHVEDIAFESAPRRSTEEAHGHCALCADRRDAVADVGASKRVVRLDHGSAPLLSRDSGVVPQPTRFRIAPKNSPPA